MPRIFTSNNDPIDFCNKCFPAEEDMIAKYGNIGDGPDGRGNCFEYDAEHPNYADFGDYQCQTCRKRLKEKDN